MMNFTEDQMVIDAGSIPNEGDIVKWRSTECKVTQVQIGNKDGAIVAIIYIDVLGTDIFTKVIREIVSTQLGTDVPLRTS
jgi:hypothetical protein